MLNFSVIIANFNCAEYVLQAIRSCTSSKKDMEILLIDDASTDNSLDVINSDAKNHPNLVIIENSENLGLGAVRNIGIKKAKGKLVFFLDSDDMLDSKIFKKTLEHYNKNKFDMLGFSGLTIGKDENQQLINNPYLRQDLQNCMSGWDYLNTIDLEKFRASTPMWVFEANFLKNSGLKFHSSLHEDEAFTLISLLKAQKVVTIQDIGYYRRIRPNSIMTTPLSLKNSFGWLKSASLIKKEFKNNPEFNEIINIRARLLVDTAIQVIIKIKKINLKNIFMLMKNLDSIILILKDKIKK